MSDQKQHLPLEWRDAPEAANMLPDNVDAPELTHLPLPKAIFKLALPAIGSMVFIMVFNLVDIWWVGKLGPEALAGISAASFIYWALQSMATLVGTGVTAMVARFVGAGKPQEAGRVVAQGLILAIGIAVVHSVGGLLTQKWLFQLMGTEGQVLRAATDYMRVLLFGLPSIFLAFHLDSTFRGLGDTRTPLKVISIGLTLNMILDPIFIFGWGPIPRMEAAGASLATILAHIIIVVLALIILNRRNIKPRFERGADFIDWNIMWRISKIGAPIALTGVLFSGSYMALTHIITQFGTAPLAALGVGHRIEGLSYNISVGFSFAASALIGQNMGAGKIERAEKSVWLCVLYIASFLALVSLLFFFFGESLFRFFTDDPAVIREGAAYLRIIALFEIFLGLEIVLEGAFGGSGNSLPPMLVSVPLTWARLPLAVLFAYTLGMESNGVWWAISITTGIKGVLLAVWFRRGRWKSQEV